MIPKGESSESKIVTRALEVSTPDDITIEQQLDQAPPNFIQQAMERAYDPDINMIRDLSIDDSELPFASNYYDFCARVCGPTTQMPFARQLWLASQLLGDICPYCTPDKLQFMANIPVDLDPHLLAKDLTLFRHGVCTKCNHTKADAIRDNKMRDYNEAVWVLGQRSGKSTTTAMIAAYVIHRYIKSPRLSSQNIGIQAANPLVATVVALTVRGAYRLLWKPIREIINDSQWYKDCFELLHDNGKRLGKELYQYAPAGMYLRIFHRGLDASPEGPSKRNLRGATRFFSATDELGHFPFDPNKTDDDENEEARERADGDEVHQVLDSSLGTVRTAVSMLYTRGVLTYPQALNMSISSPASWQDKVMRLFTASTDSPTMFGVRAATWEINPFYTASSPVIRAAYARDARKAERDWGANPPKLGADVFQKDLVKSLFDGNRNSHAVVYNNVPGYTRGRLVRLREPALLPPSLLLLDAGLIDNAFACVVMHRIRPEDMDKPEHIDNFRVTCAVEIVPAPDTKLDYPYIYHNVIKRLLEDHNIREVYADRWNSAYILRQIELDTAGFTRCFNYMVKPSDSAAFQATAHSLQIHLPQMDCEFDYAEAAGDYRTMLLKNPIGHLYRQFLTVQPYQGILTKGQGSTDDLFRCVMLGASRLLDPKIRHRFGTYLYKERAGISVSAASAIIVGSRSSGGHRNSYN